MNFKILFTGLTVAGLLFATSCTDDDEVKTSFDTQIKPILVAKCAPCHLKDGGSPRLYDNYDVVKADVDKIISRIEKDVKDPLFMPLGATAKLPQAEIDLIKKWKADGLAK
jgi:hypothetical protein